jgi:hypothetical protein
VAIFLGRPPGTPERAMDRLKRTRDSAHGRDMITRRLATVEPVFGNIRHHKGMHRVTRRGEHKVDGPWKRFCLVHTIEKLAHLALAG